MTGTASGNEPSQPASGDALPVVDYLDQLLRLKAEFENYRKRVDREKPEYLRLGRAAVLAKLLPLYDLLQKAHQEVQSSHNDTPLAKGMAGIFKEFDKLWMVKDLDIIKPLENGRTSLRIENVEAVTP